MPFPSLHKAASSAALGVLGTVFGSLGDGGELGHFGCPTFSMDGSNVASELGRLVLSLVLSHTQQQPKLAFILGALSIWRHHIKPAISVEWERATNRVK